MYRVKEMVQHRNLHSYLVETKTDLFEDMPPPDEKWLKEIAQRLNNESNYNISTVFFLSANFHFQEYFFQTSAKTPSSLVAPLARAICDELQKTVHFDWEEYRKGYAKINC